MKTLALLAIATLTGAVANASVVLNASSNPSLSTGLIIVTDNVGTLLAADFVGDNTITDSVTLQSAFLVDDGVVDSTELGTDGVSQFVSLSVILGTFTGDSILAVGTPLTPLSNAALIDLVGVDQLGLSFLGQVPNGDNQLFIFNVTSISATPEPGTALPAAFAGIGILAFMRKRLLSRG